MKGLMKIFLLVTGVLLITYLGVSAYQVMNTIPVKRTPVVGTPTDVGLQYEDVEFPSRGGSVKLSGWLIRGQGKSAIIVVSSAGQNRVDSNIGLEFTRDLVDQGFSVLMFDFRGRGNSEGKGLLLIHDSEDIGGAVDFMKTLKYTDISLVAFSAGAASSLIYASQNSLTCMVSDSSFSDVGLMYMRKGIEKGYPHVIVSLLEPGYFFMAKLIYGYDRVDPVDIVKKISCPVLFIHGSADTVPFEQCQQLYVAKADPNDEIWIVEGAKHCQAYKTNPQEYIRKIIEFFRRGVQNHS